MFRTLENMDFEGKKVIVRIDMDVPLDEDGGVKDDFRLQKAIPTLKYLKEKGAKQIIIIGHIGRPKGEVVEALRTTGVGKKLSELLGEEVLKFDDCIELDTLETHKFVLLENLRFHSGEKENSEDFAKKLANIGDIFVLDAFAVSHRDHASITGIQKYLPSCAGIQLKKEIEALNITDAQTPIIAILGAAKVKDKIALIEELLKKVDKILLCGGIIFTFFKAKGLEIGNSLLDEQSIETAKKYLGNEKIVLPEDVVVAHEISEGVENKTVSIDQIPEEFIGLDVGEKTVANFKEILSTAKTIIWNGPMGKFETKPFGKATKEIAEFIITLGAVSIVGGGDTTSAIRSFGLENKFTHVSTGGGASLELLEGKTLPGIKALEENMEKFT
ncbi:phosphoglycerate kinase [Candidatus Woesearchaeota archaeon]|nr:phosphoglycerate kinase [Candidatus Woesearchaeota archaeon]